MERKGIRRLGTDYPQHRLPHLPLPQAGPESLNSPKKTHSSQEDAGSVLVPWGGHLTSKAPPYIVK